MIEYMYPEYYIKFLEKALLKNELFEFFVGKGEYQSVNPYGNTPVDPILVIQTIKLYMERDESIVDKMVQEVEKISMDADYSWLSLYYLIDIIDFSKYSKINLNEIVVNIQNNLIRNKERLIQDKRWMGASWPDGLWGDVKRMANNIRTNYGVIINLENFT
jgi:hypothetical protein